MAEHLSSQDKTLSSFHLRTLFIWFLTSAFVTFEPAPFDFLFPFVGFIFLTRHGTLHFPKESRILFPSLLLFLLANLIATLAADDAALAGMYATITFYMLVLAVFVSLLVMNFGYEALHKIMESYTLIAVFSAVAGILGVIHFLPSSLAEEVLLNDRAKAFFKDPNVFAPFLVIPMMYSIDRFFSDRKRVFMWGGAVLILLCGILLSFSRAAWGVSVMAIMGYFLMISLVEGRFTRFLKYALYFVVFSAVVGGVLMALTTESNMTDFFAERFRMQDYDTDRFAVQRAAIQSGIDKPWGIGPGQAEAAFDAVGSRHTGATHSLYIRIFSETGFLGFLSFFAILAVTVRKSFWLCFSGIEKYRSLHCAFIASLGAMLANSFVIDSIHWRHFFVQLGLIWGLDIYNQWHRMDHQFR